MILGRPLLDTVAARGKPLDRAEALVELGRLEEAEDHLSRAGEGAKGAGRAEVVRARILAARGDFLAALAGLAEVAPEAPCAVLEQARLLGLLGHFDEAIASLDGSPEPGARLILAGLHLEAGESAPASLQIPAEDAEPRAAAAGDRAWSARACLSRCEIELLRGELLFQGRDAPAALAPLRRARSLAGRCGSPTAIAVASARIGEAHAHALNPWRALRAVTRAMDLAALGRVHRGALPGIHYRAFVVYRGCGHEPLAESALQSGHHIVLQLASGIDDRAYRETFLLDNRDCQRLVGAWKGESGWGSDVPRG